MPVTGMRWRLEPGQFSIVQFGRGGWEIPQIIDETPIFYLNTDKEAYFDLYGNRITDVPWLHEGRHVSRFSLLPLGKSGIPIIHVRTLLLSRYSQDWEFDYLFIYQDGTFERVVEVGWSTDDTILYAAADGTLYARWEWDGAHYDRIDFVGNRAYATRIAEAYQMHDSLAWANLITGATGIPFETIWFGVVEPHYLPGTDIWLNPIFIGAGFGLNQVHPLYTLHDEIVNTILQGGHF
jgi:hypothetical protein